VCIGGSPKGEGLTYLPTNLLGGEKVSPEFQQWMEKRILRLKQSRFWEKNPDRPRWVGERRREERSTFPQSVSEGKPRIWLQDATDRKKDGSVIPLIKEQRKKKKKEHPLNPGEFREKKEMCH